MLQKNESALTEAITEALETMAFMAALPPEEQLPTPDQCVLASIGFNGPTCGNIEMLAGMEFTWIIAANVMGIDCDDQEAQIQGTDAFKELLNTTCGVLLPRLASTSADVFNVTIPEAKNSSLGTDWELFVSQGGVTLLDVNGNLLGHCPEYPIRP